MQYDLQNRKDNSIFSDPKVSLDTSKSSALTLQQQRRQQDLVQQRALRILNNQSSLYTSNTGMEGVEMEYLKGKQQQEGGQRTQAGCVRCQPTLYKYPGGMNSQLGDNLGENVVCTICQYAEQGNACNQRYAYRY